MAFTKHYKVCTLLNKNNNYIINCTKECDENIIRIPIFPVGGICLNQNQITNQRTNLSYFNSQPSCQFSLAYFQQKKNYIEGNNNFIKV